MAKKITFKDPNGTFNLGGQVIGQHHLDEKLYNYIIGLNPTHADLFDVVDEDEKPKTEPKPKTEAKSKSE